MGGQCECGLTNKCACGLTGEGRGRNKPKLPLVRRISDKLQTSCPPTCPLVHFVGPKLVALDRQNSGRYKGLLGKDTHDRVEATCQIHRPYIEVGKDALEEVTII